MNPPTIDADALFAILKPEVEKLCYNAPLFGEITLKATIHQGNIAKISTGIEISCKIDPRLLNREGRK